MLSKSKITFIKSLHQKKFREEERLFIAEGNKVIEELLKSSFVVKTIVATSNYLSSIDQKVLSLVPEVIEVKASEMERISALTTPQEVLAVVEMPQRVLEVADLKGKLTLLLDDVRDPGNFGTIVRIAHWYGIGQIVASLNSVDSFNPKVVQAAMGSLFHVPVYNIGLEGLLSQVKAETELPVYATVLGGESLFEASLSQEGLLILGNESMGIRTSLQELSSQKLTIPSFELQQGNKPESLNVAVSAAIVLSEFRRKAQ
jgi:TrmH family RNA methyltransferase